MWKQDDVARFVRMSIREDFRWRCNKMDVQWWPSDQYYKASKPVQLKCERRKTAKESQAEHDSEQKQDDDVEETTAWEANQSLTLLSNELRDT